MPREHRDRHQIEDGYGELVARGDVDQEDDRKQCQGDCVLHQLTLRLDEIDETQKEPIILASGWTRAVYGLDPEITGAADAPIMPLRHLSSIAVRLPRENKKGQPTAWSAAHYSAGN